ncbi:hypothetical protein ACFLVL_02965 [Chloroflexota bacterium]
MRKVLIITILGVILGALFGWFFGWAIKEDKIMVATILSGTISGGLAAYIGAIIYRNRSNT